MGSLFLPATLVKYIKITLFYSTVCVTGVSWQVCDYEVTSDEDVLKYQVHIGLYQANLTMARMPLDGNHYMEYHNVKIGWSEGTDCNTIL